MNIETASRRLDSLGNSTRLRIFRMLVRAGGAGMAVGRLQDELGLPASTLSHHLHRLMSEGLVTQERQTTTLICRADYEAMQGLVDFLVAECCTLSPPPPSSVSRS
ncbi:MAG: helix-turn-helix transcriptional regulator [Rhizobiaceae bacterium]|nr:helix-turn-helix transcriptional regulator [Rhizobiaceae bacterium]